MGLGKRIVQWLAHTPNAAIRNGWTAALCTFPYFISKTWQHLDENPGDSRLGFALRAMPTVGVFLGAYLGTAVLHVFTKEKNALRLEDYKKIKTLEQHLAQQQPPHTPFEGEKKISYKLKDMLKYYHIPFFRHSAESVEKNAYENKNPLLALDAAIKYGGSRKQFDKSLLIIRDALDWLNGKKPIVNIATHIMFWYIKLALKVVRKLDVREPGMYMVSAAYDSIMNPEHAWYWSQLGRMVTTEFNTTYKKEMYVFHALLATAQKRSDQQQAWQDAFAVMNEECTPERLGESRHPTWILKDEDKQFFSGTFVFKGNDNLEELENERKATIQLEQILGETAISPQPLHITDQLQNGLYVYIMRHLSGELLAKQLIKGDKSGLNKVIPTLARIHARYPTQGLPHVDITQKTYKKLEQLGMTDAMQLFKPAIDDLQTQPIWAVNADAHPEQWMMLNNPHITAKTSFLDTELKEVQPAILDSANLFEYCGEFNTAQRQAFVLQFADNLREEGICTNNPTLRAYTGNMNALFKAHNNATLHRTLCLLVAWNEKGRNRTKEEKEHLVKNAIRAVDDLKIGNPGYYEQNKEQYDKLPEFYAKIPELKPS